MDLRDDERLAEHLDHGNRGAHPRLEPELDASRRRGREELCAVLRDELLVRGDDGLVRGEQVEDLRPRRLDAAHDLRDDDDRRVVANRAGIGGQDPGSGTKPRSLSRSRTRARTTRRR